MPRMKNNWAYAWSSFTTVHLVSFTENQVGLIVCSNANKFGFCVDISDTIMYRAYFNVPTGTFVLGDLRSVLEDLVTRA